MFPRQREASAAQQAQLDFFHKLGYSTAQVRDVQQHLGPGSDTNKVLGELVRLGSVPRVSVLVSRGNGQSSAPQPSPDQELLRPVVVDGSNVAMR